MEIPHEFLLQHHGEVNGTTPGNSASFSVDPSNVHISFILLEMACPQPPLFFLCVCGIAHSVTPLGNSKFNNQDPQKFCMFVFFLEQPDNLPWPNIAMWAFLSLLYKAQNKLKKTDIYLGNTSIAKMSQRYMIVIKDFHGDCT